MVLLDTWVQIVPGRNVLNCIVVQYMYFYKSIFEVDVIDKWNQCNVFNGRFNYVSRCTIHTWLSIHGWFWCEGCVINNLILCLTFNKAKTYSKFSFLHVPKEFPLLQPLSIIIATFSHFIIINFIMNINILLIINMLFRFDLLKVILLFKFHLMVALGSSISRKKSLTILFVYLFVW